MGVPFSAEHASAAQLVLMPSLGTDIFYIAIHCWGHAPVSPNGLNSTSISRIAISGESRVRNHHHPHDHRLIHMMTSCPNVPS